VQCTITQILRSILYARVHLKYMCKPGRFYYSCVTVTNTSGLCQEVDCGL
jgi:hypothetical protein